MDNQIKAVIFDLGRVLVDFNHLIAADKIMQFTDKGKDDIFNLFFDSCLTKEFEEGQISPEGFFVKVGEALGLQLTYAEFLPIWNEIFFLNKHNTEVHTLAKALRNSYKTALLTNVNILHFEYLKEKFDIFSPFHHIITSFDLKVRKPEATIYRKALEILDVKAQEAFYTDDRPELVLSAKELGIRAFVFTGPEQLKKDLISSGVVLADTPLYC